MDGQVLQKEIIIGDNKYLATVKKLDGYTTVTNVSKSKYEVKIYGNYDIVFNKPNLIYLGYPIIANKHDSYIEAVKLAAKVIRDRYGDIDPIKEFEDWDGNCDV